MTTSVIGCGNLNRRDDGAGIFVVRKLMTEIDLNTYKQIRLFDAGTAGVDVMFHARGSNNLIIVDASKTGAEPGSIFKVPANELVNVPQPSYSLHNFRWDQAIFVGRQIFKTEFPEKIDVYLIEAENLDFGCELSPCVANAADRVAQLILNELIFPQTLIRNGFIFIDADTCDRFFPGTQSVAILPGEQRNQLLVLPVMQQGAGGLLLKVRNKNGDRAIEAADYLRALDIDTDDEISCESKWDAGQHALRITMLSKRD